MSIPRCHVYRLGMIPYEQAWDLQREMAAEIGAGEREPALLLLEHPHTFTFGRQGNADHLLWNEDLIKKHDVAVHWVDRGGDITYHGPGQLVGYPLLPLGRVDYTDHLPRADYVGYIRKLERTLIAALDSLGITGIGIDGLTGVWIPAEIASQINAINKPAKICSIGIRVSSSGVSQHGFAFNINPQMSYWQGIIACGEPNFPSIALADLLDQPPDMRRMQDLVVAAFVDVFRFAVLEQSALP